MEPELNPSVAVTAIPLEDDGVFPNNPVLPTLLYHGALNLHGVEDPALFLLHIFSRNGWSNGWQNGIYPYHHYHSTAHEVLGCHRGRARVRLGGSEGPAVVFERGDVLIIPAGVSHQRLEASSDFAVVGAYADGNDYDMNRGTPGERPRADENIAALAVPRSDPAFGTAGPLTIQWSLQLQTVSADRASTPESAR